MSKKKWLLAIITLIGIGYLIVSKVNPAIGTAVDNVVGPAIGTSVSGIITAVTQSSQWQVWGNYMSFAIGGIIFTMLTWKGRTFYHKLVGPKIVGTKEAAWQTTPPVAQPVAIPQQPAIVQPQQVTPAPTPQPQPQEQPKQ